MSDQPTVSAYDPVAGEILDDASDALSNVLTGLAEDMASRRGDSVVRVQDVQEPFRSCCRCSVPSPVRT